MAKWLVVKLADEIPEKEMLHLLNNVTFHEASAWYESVPDVFRSAEALDQAMNTWLSDRRPGELLAVTRW